jgi:hypothetical protein
MLSAAFTCCFISNPGHAANTCKPEQLAMLSAAFTCCFISYPGHAANTCKPGWLLFGYRVPAAKLRH